MKMTIFLFTFSRGRVFSTKNLGEFLSSKGKGLTQPLPLLMTDLVFLDGPTLIAALTWPAPRAVQGSWCREGAHTALPQQTLSPQCV